MRNFKNYDVWKLSHQLVLKIYEITEKFPKSETYGLTSQFRRAAMSISLNIAEGCGRGSDLDFKKFLIIAFGSANETEYCIILSKDLKYIEEEKYQELNTDIEGVKMKLAKLISKIHSDINNK